MWQEEDKDRYFGELRLIRDRYEKYWKPRIDPYFIYDWIKIFTPIEDNVWCDIRFVGVPFYPQFPVGKYYVDFADPIKKVGVEVLSKYHTDIDKEVKRFNDLSKMGYFIYPIMGRDTYNDKSEIIIRCISKIFDYQPSCFASVWGERGGTWENLDTQEDT